MLWKVSKTLFPPHILFSNNIPEKSENKTANGGENTKMDESKHVDKNMSDLNDGKLIVNKRINDPEQPPSKNVAVINLSDKDHTGENELVRTIFQGYGPGSYTVLLTEKGRKHMDLVWKVEIYEKEGDKIPFRTKENHFRNVIVTREPPWTGRRKYVPE